MGKTLLSIFVLFLIACDSSSTTDDNFSITGSTDAIEESLGISVNLEAPLFDEVVAGTPTSLTLGVFQIYLGASADCTDAELLVDNGDTAEDFDLSASPTLFTGTVEDGTYNCLVLVMDDNIRFVPDAVAETAFPGICTAGEEVVFDIYREDSDDTAWKDIDGNDVTARGLPGDPESDLVSIFATTDPEAAMTALDISENQVGELTAGLVVPASATFFADFSDSISTNDGFCWVEGGELGFR